MAASIPRSVCAWCGEGGATQWLCRRCDEEPWGRGGARFVLRRKWKRSRFVVEIVDRAYLYTHVQLDAAAARRPYQAARDLNIEHRP